MTNAVAVIRTLVGLLFLFFGLNHFLQFIPMNPPPLSERAAGFMSAIKSSGYLDLVKVIEVVGGTMLVTRLFVPLGITILMPVTINIICWEIFLMGSPGIGCVLGALLVFLILGYYRYFSGLLTPFATPHNPIGLKD